MGKKRAALDLGEWQVRPGIPPDLARIDADASPASSGKRAVDEARLDALGKRLGELQNRLYASKQRSMLLILQGMDASGKDGVIRSVFSQISPLGVQAHAFGVPVGAELTHDFLWRVHSRTPARGEIAIFNRSQYEDVVVTRVRKTVPEDLIIRRIEHIRQFEALLSDQGTLIIKCFLHLSYKEQGKRLKERLTMPEKRWKLQQSDLDDRRLWKDFCGAYESALGATSTAHAPWTIIPANSKFQRDLMVTELLVAGLEGMDLHYPASTLPKSARIPE